MAFEDLLNPSSDPFLKHKREEDCMKSPEPPGAGSNVPLPPPGLSSFRIPPPGSSGSSTPTQQPADKWTTGQPPDQWTTTKP